MTAYVHGYTPEEQRRLVEQAEHWRDELILPGTELPPGTRLLEVGCGVGAVLGILGQGLLDTPDAAMGWTVHKAHGLAASVH